MKILQIERCQETDTDNYTKITFSNWYGKKYTEVCITPIWSNSTHYAKSGKFIPIDLWRTVKSFLKTKENKHKY